MAEILTQRERDIMRGRIIAGHEAANSLVIALLDTADHWKQRAELAEQRYSYLRNLLLSGKFYMYKASGMTADQFDQRIDEDRTL